MADDKKQPDGIIDIRGEVCPYTFIKAKLALEDISPGGILEIIVDHAPAAENVPRSMENDGQEIVSVEKGEGRDWKITVKRTV